MSVHYPADYEVFSLVRIDDVRCKPKDQSLIRYVSDKIGFDFIATAESDKTLEVVRDLEQIIGREIVWVTGSSFDQLINKRKAIPNKMWRFCTTEMKMRPIWDWWYKNISEKVKMGIGFRYDEKERAENIQNKFKGIVGEYGSRNKWEEIEWREAFFPLIENRITHYPIYQWAKSSGLDFPEDSNCVGCFWKPIQQLRKNWDEEKNKMQWFSDQEEKSTWKTEMKYEQIKKVGLQTDFFFGTGSGCQAGFCTD